MCPDYIIKEWNETNFDVNKLFYTRIAYEKKNYAYVSDVARLYALLNDGGIYLDTDVEVVQPFDGYLDNKAFIGFERQGSIGTCVIGADKNSRFIMDFYREYETITEYPKILLPNTFIAFRILSNKGLKDNNCYQIIDDYCTVYPKDYFTAKDFETGRIYKTSNTVSIHHFSATWLPIWSRCELKFWNLLGLKNYDLIHKVSHFVKREKNV